MKRRRRKKGKSGVVAVFLVLAVIAGAWFFLRKTTEDTFLRLNPHINTVVIDAGHGGEDGGAKALSGMLESGINLEISKKAELLMRFYGVKTVMVRTEDISIHDTGLTTFADKKRSDLNNRVKLVNSTPNAVLLSIHQNSFTESQYFGAQAFYARDGISKTLAEVIQTQMLTLDTENTRKIKPAAEDLFLMNNVNCPAVLVECGFLSNAKDSANLTSEKYQTKVAMAIVSAFTLWE